MDRSVCLLVFIVLVIGPSPAAWAGSGADLVVFEVREAGEIYDPLDGTVVRYLTGGDPNGLFFEARSIVGVPLGEILRAPDLSGAPPSIGTPATVISFFEADGATPFTSPLFHPVVCTVAPGTLGMYVVDALPSGVLYFFTSTDGGDSWVLAGTPLLPLPGGGSGVVAAVRVDNVFHVDGFEVRVYYQTGGGAIRFVRSSIVAVGTEKYTSLDSGTDAAVLEAAESGGVTGFSPTGRLVPLDSGGLGLFFVPQSDGYIGFAESDSGLDNWTVTRDGSNPVLSTAANGLAPDPSRPEIKEIAVVETATGWTLYFTGGVPSGPLLNRAVGRASVVQLTNVEFLRGDTNDDGMLGVADAVFALTYLFGGGTTDCVDAIDIDDSGDVDIADPIALLSYLFTQGPPPAAPFPVCGVDPSPDPVTCFDQNSCP